LTIPAVAGCRVVQLRTVTNHSLLPTHPRTEPIQERCRYRLFKIAVRMLGCARAWSDAIVSFRTQ